MRGIEVFSLGSIAERLKDSFTTGLLLLNPRSYALGLVGENGEVTGGLVGSIAGRSLSIFGRTISLTAKAIALILGVAILIALFLLRGITAGVLGGLSSRGLRGASRPSGALAAVMLRLLTEDLARIASILGQHIGAAALTVFGYILLFLGLRGSLGSLRTRRRR